MKETKKENGKSQQTRLSVLQLVTITNTGPLQKHWTVTETSSRYRNAQPLQQHQAVAETTRTVTGTPSRRSETQNRFRNTKLFSGQIASLNKRISSAEKSGNFNLEGRTHLCAFEVAIMLLFHCLLRTSVKHLRSCTNGIGPTGRFF